MAMQTSSYPVAYELDEPQALSRWLWLFKWLLLIPHMVALLFLGVVFIVLLFAAWVAILITGRYPRGLFDFIVGTNRWSMRVTAYLLHMTDSYPPFSLQDDSAFPMRLSVEYPQSSNRLTVFFRWILAIPHWIIVGVLDDVLWVLALINVVVVIVTGKPNSEIFRVMVGINRWSARVTMYCVLTTDVYPPFSLD